MGYGDLTPTSDFARVFTIVYLFVGFGVLVAFTTSVARHSIQHRVEVAELARTRLSARLENRPAERGDRNRDSSGMGGSRLSSAISKCPAADCTGAASLTVRVRVREWLPELALGR